MEGGGGGGSSSSWTWPGLGAGGSGSCEEEPPRGPESPSALRVPVAGGRCLASAASECCGRCRGNNISFYDIVCNSASAYSESPEVVCSHLVQPQGAPAAVTTAGTDTLLTSVGVAVDEAPPCITKTVLHDSVRKGLDPDPDPDPDPGPNPAPDPLGFMFVKTSLKLNQVVFCFFFICDIITM